MKGETKEARFARVAEKRVQRVLDSLKSLSNCADKRIYKWNDEQLRKMWRAIDNELKGCKDRYQSPGMDEFKL